MNLTVDTMRWRDLSDICNQIYKDNNYMTPFQNYEFLKISGLGRNDKNPLEALCYHEINFVLYRSLHPIAIAPFYYKKIHSGYELKLRGALTSASPLGFLYDVSFSKEEFDFLMQNIYDFFGKKVFISFERIQERSLLYKYSLDRVMSSKIQKSISVTIPIRKNYEDWYKSLTKSVRQNIRTSYNRLNTDGKDFKFILYIDKLPLKSAQNDMMKLFSRRLCEHSYINPKILGPILYFFKQKHPMTKGLYKGGIFIGATLYCQQSLMGFYSGMIGNNGCAIISRLAINLDFSRYSPGGILINETMKLLCADGGRDVVREFDLARGTEKYKYDYGGIEHYTFDFVLELPY